MSFIATVFVVAQPADLAPSEDQEDGVLEGPARHGGGSGSGRPSAPPTPDFLRVMLLRVYFDDYTATSRFTQAEVDGIFNDDMDGLWQNTSYGHVGIDAQVSALYELPDNRADYITDCPEEGFPACPTDNGNPPPSGTVLSGDLSSGAEFSNVLNDAIDSAPAGLNWSDLDTIMVLMAETSAQFYRGLGGRCDLPQGPGGTVANVGCAIYSENPTENLNQAWGRWAHEVGHTLQQGGPAHPSNYRSEFDLMDSNLPGQTGVFEKQAHTAFPGWLDPFKYLEFDPVGGGGIANIWAMEYDPDDMPNVQAVKAKITDNLYYLISVRRSILGDDLNGDYTPFGIPDEGVLIERVEEGADQWVTIQGKGGSRNVLWQEGDQFINAADGIRVTVNQSLDPDGDNYRVIVDYNKAALQPDIAMEPWRSPPGNTWETTDIWIDSPVNGYDNYVWGTWTDVFGNPVPRGNGDPPAVGLVNRVYARVRNIGAMTAGSVVVHVEVTDPLGVGISGSNGFVEIGSVDWTDFPGLDMITPGTYEDVYVEWTPDVDISEVEIEDGMFNFHSCLRVIMDHVPGEHIFGNQDGDEEQENIDRFAYVPPEEGGSGGPYDAVMRVRNDDMVREKYFHLVYDEDLPDDWWFDVNGGVDVLLLGPNEVRDIPVQITPIGPSPPLGSEFNLEVQAYSWSYLMNDMDMTDWHIAPTTLGGVVFNARVMRASEIVAHPQLTPTGVRVTGQLVILDFSSFFDALYPFRVSLVGVGADGRLIPDTIVTVDVDSDGNFDGEIPLPDPRIVEVVVMFAGTEDLAPVGTAFMPLQLEPEVRITPRTLNLKSEGRWVMAKLLFESEVVDMVLPGSLKLEGIDAYRVKVLDNYTLQVKFSREALIALLSPGDVTLCVSGELTDGRTFEAYDTIRVIRRGK